MAALYSSDDGGFNALLAIAACGSVCDSRSQDHRQHHVGYISTPVHVCSYWGPAL